MITPTGNFTPCWASKLFKKSLTAFMIIFSNTTYFSDRRDWGGLNARLGRFWWIDLDGKRSREDTYNPHAVHRFLKIPPALIDDWLTLFSTNLFDHLSDEDARAWLARATKMAEWIRTDLQQHNK